MDSLCEDDEEVQNMRPEHRYYLFNYLEVNKEKLNLTALDDAKQSAPFNAKLDFITLQLKVTIQTTKRNYAKVAQKVDQIIGNEINYSEIVVDQS